MTTARDLWILIGGTGQQFGLTAASLALVGALPPPADVLLIDADGQGPRWEALQRALDLVRADRLTQRAPTDEPLPPVVRAAPLTRRCLQEEYPDDELLPVFYSDALSRHLVSNGFHAEPSLGAASYYPSLARASRVSGGRGVGPAAGPAAEDELATFLDNVGEPHPLSRRIIVVASSAGGTGAGLWNLVCRAITSRGEIWRQATRLVFFGPLFRLDETTEVDGTGQRLTTARLDENFAAGFTYLTQSRRTGSPPPFGAAYVVSYPAGAERPVASTKREDASASRLALVAASALSHQPKVFDGTIYGFRADRSSTARLEEAIFVSRGGRVSTGADTRALTAAASQSFLALSRVNLARATGGLALFARAKVSRRILRALTVADAQEPRLSAERVARWQGTDFDANQNGAPTLRGAAQKAHALAAEFGRWLSVDDKLVASPVERAATRVHRVRWQDALDRSAGDDAAGDHPSFHVRSWLLAVAEGAIRAGGAGASLTPTGSTVDYTPLSTGSSGQLGWNALDSAALDSFAADLKPGSFPTPWAQARWLAAQLGESPNPEALAASTVAWRAVLGGYVSVGSPLHTPLAKTAAFVEFGDASKGVVPLVFNVDVPSLGVARGAVVGAIHPTAGPFLGVGFAELAGVVERHSALFDLDIRRLAARIAIGRRPAPWSRAVFALGSGHPPKDTDSSLTSVTLPIEGGPVTTMQLPAPLVMGAEGGSTVTERIPGSFVREARRLIGFKDGQTGRLIPSLLPTRDWDEGIALLCRQGSWPESTLLAETVSFQRPGGDGRPTPAGQESTSAFEWLADWNIEVWPGPAAPAEWRFFGLALEPITELALQSCRVTLIVERNGTLSRLDLSGNGRVARPYEWIDGRPRYLAIECPTASGVPAIGFFPLLGPPSTRRSGGTTTVALDLGTTRSALAVHVPDGAGRDIGFVDGRHVVVAESGNTPTHPRRMLTRTWLPEFDTSSSQIPAQGPGGLHVVIHGSTLLRRRSAASPARPFADFSIPSTPVPLVANQPVEVGDLKWRGSESDVEDFVTLSTLVAVAQADLRSLTGTAPAEVQLHFSFPLAFSNQRREVLTRATTRAAARVAEYSGIRSTLAGLCSESTLATLKQVDSPWTMTVDIGGGTTDYAVVFRHDGRVYPLLTDSLHFGGGLMIERAVRRLRPETQELEGRRRGYDLRRGNRGVLELDRRDSQEALAVLFQTIWEYTARLLAGSLIRAGRGVLPPHLAGQGEDLASALRSSVEGGPRVVVILIGGGWRLLEQTYDINWATSGPGTGNEDFFRSPLHSRVQSLRATHGPASSLQLEVDTQQLVQGEEKTRLARNMVEYWAAATAQNMTTTAQGVYTLSGLDLNNSATWFDAIERAHERASLLPSPALPDGLPPEVAATCPSRNKGEFGAAQLHFQQAAAQAPPNKLSKSPYGAYVEAVVRPRILAVEGAS